MPNTSREAVLPGKKWLSVDGSPRLAYLARHWPDFCNCLQCLVPGMTSRLRGAAGLRPGGDDPSPAWNAAAWAQAASCAVMSGTAGHVGSTREPTCVAPVTRGRLPVLTSRYLSGSLGDGEGGEGCGRHRSAETLPGLRPEAGQEGARLAVTEGIGWRVLHPPQVSCFKFLGSRRRRAAAAGASFLPMASAPPEVFGLRRRPNCWPDGRERVGWSPCRLRRYGGARGRRGGDVEPLPTRHSVVAITLSDTC
jgi:hypothetical protein